MDLESFEQKNSATKPNKCTTCALDFEILKELHAGRDRRPKPVSYPMISKWLKEEHNVEIQQTTIRAHFVAGHSL